MPSLRAAFLAVCCTVAAYTAASNGVCTPAASCILPVPTPAPPRSSLAENLQLIRCHLSCISEQHIHIQLLNQGTTWPSYSFSNLPCTSRHKVDQCTIGCMTKARALSLTVNRCRDQCVSECETDEDTAQNGCETSCRRTFCRYGCNLYQSLQSESNTALSRPTAAPVITSHPDSNSARKLFVSNVSSAMPPSQLVSGLSRSTPQNISYLYKIQHGSDISYIWQKDAIMSLDLSAFACNQIQVSFSVVSEGGQSEFSPDQSLCLDGVERWPSRVNHSSINISYAEDTRDSYIGYSTANISWSRPQDYQYLTSYTIFIYTRTERCGGVNHMYEYRNIRKDATWFFISATQPNGVPMFGCSYTVSIVPMPERPNQNRPTTTMAPDLGEPDPEMRLHCRREWDERGSINISVNWNLSSLSSLRAIRRFTVVPLLIDSSRPGLFGRLNEYSRQWILPEEGTSYSTLLTNFPPQRTQSYKYKIEVRVERASGYWWRRVPPTETCTLSAESEPPSPVTGLTVGSVHTDREGWGGGGYMAQFDISWSPPFTTNGALTEYEVNIVTQPSEDGLVLFHSTQPATHLSMEVNITFPLNASTHCVYALVRSRNDYMWSEWSKPEIVPLDQQCRHSVSNASNESVTLFYKRTGEEAVRMAQISCESGLESTASNTISDKLLTLEHRLDSVPDMVRVQSVAESLLERLRTLERKIDQIVDAVSSQQSGSGG